MLSFQHADLRRLYDYWLRHRPVADPAAFHLSALALPAHTIPAREDIDPIDLGWMLDRISLFECHSGPPAGLPEGVVRFRCRVAGTWYSLRFDFEANGSWLDDWPDSAMRNSAMALYRLIHADGRPRRVIRQFTVDGITSMYEGAALPLNDKAHPGVAMIMVGAASVTNPDMAGLKLIFEAGTYRNWSSD